MQIKGRPFSEIQEEKEPYLTAAHTRIVGIVRPREELYDRINRRFDAMMAAGALVLRHFPITRERHAELRAALVARQQRSGAP